MSTRKGTVVDKRASKNGAPVLINGAGKSILGELQRWLRERPAPLSIDVQLTLPIETLHLCADIAERTGKLDRHQLIALRNYADAGNNLEEGVRLAVNEICRAAMNGRKQGRLKLTATIKRKEAKTDASAR